MKAKPIRDNSPEGHLRRAHVFGEKQWTSLLAAGLDESTRERIAALPPAERRKAVTDALRTRRKAEMVAMLPTQRIAAMLAENSEADVYEVLYPFIMEAGDDWTERLKDPVFARRVERALSFSRRLRTEHLHAEEDRAAGLTGPLATGRMSKPMTQAAIHALVLTRYPKHRKHTTKWWERYIEKPGILVERPDYRTVRIDVGQLRASLPLLTDEDISRLVA